MSTFALPTSELKPALAGFGKIINRRTTLPVLGTVKIERTREGWVALTGTNLDQFATLRLEQPSDGEPGSILVPYEDLVKTLKACGKSPTITVEYPESGQPVIRYSIGNQSVENPFENIPVAEFPEIPKVESERIPLSDSLRQSIHQAFACASTDETRFVINGVFIDVSRKDGHYVVGTNGRQLYSSNSFSLPLTESIILPANKFVGWKDFSADGEWHLKAPAPSKVTTPWFQLSSRRWRLIGRLIDGNYPNWRQVIPDAKGFKTSLELDPEKVADVVQTIGQMPCHDSQNFNLGIEISSGTVRLLGKAPNADGWTAVEVNGFKVTGPDAKVYLNRQYLSKALQFGLTTIQINDGLSPLRLSSAGRQVIIMPIHPNAAGQASEPSVAQPVPVEDVSVAGPQPIHQPETVPTVSQPESTPPMISHHTDAGTPGSPKIAEQEPTDKFEESLQVIESLRTAFQSGLNTLKDLGAKLKALQRENKSTSKELQGIRATIRSLQSLKV